MIFKKLASFIRFFDLFEVSANIKYNGDNVSSIYGGCISFLAITLTIILAFPVIKDFITFNNYSYTTQSQIKR